MEGWWWWWWWWWCVACMNTSTITQTHIPNKHEGSDTFQGLSGDGTMDIHSGGIDLRFPHHENEVAQVCMYVRCG